MAGGIIFTGGIYIVNVLNEYISSSKSRQHSEELGMRLYVRRQSRGDSGGRAGPGAVTTAIKKHTKRCKIPSSYRDGWS